MSPKNAREMSVYTLRSDRFQTTYDENALPRSVTIEVNTLSGKPLRLSSLRGKYVVLDFWAGTEGASPARIQFLKTLYRRFAGNPKFAFVGLSFVEDLDAQRQVMQKRELPWTHGLLGPESKVLSDYGSAGVPHLLLIAPDGTVLRRGIEPAELGQELEKLLAEPE